MVTKKTSPTEAVENEAVNNGINFTYEGIDFSVPPAKLWPLEAIEAQERSQLLSFLREVLGAEGYTNLRKVAKTLGDINDFSEAMYGAMDLDAGK